MATEYDAKAERKQHLILGLFIAQIAVIAPFAWKATSVLRNDIGPLDPGFVTPDLSALSCLASSTSVVIEPCGPNHPNCERHRASLIKNVLPSSINQGVNFRVVDNVAELVPPLGGSEAKNEAVVRKWLEANVEPHNNSFMIVYRFSHDSSDGSPYHFFVSSGNWGWINVDISVENAVEASVQELITFERSQLSVDVATEKKMPIQYPHSMLLRFILVNADPATTQVDWNFPEIQRAYLAPLLDELQRVASIDVESQMLGFIAFDNVERSQDGGFLLPVRELESFSSLFDWNFGSRERSRQKTLNFVVHVSARSPLRIPTDEGDTQAFHIPGWGGGFLLDHDMGKYELGSEELQAPFGVFVSQIRQHFGLIGTFEPTSTRSYLPGSQGWNAWEINAIQRKVTLARLKGSYNTQLALRSLISEAPNMNVPKRVVDNLKHAMDDFLLATEECRAGIVSVSLSRTSLNFAEKAFFDTAMVPQISFPTHHLYAVYLPLLAPLFIPVMATLYTEFSLWKKRRADLRATENQKTQ